MSHGNIDEKNTLFLRFHVGEAKGEGGRSYDLSTHASTNPCIRSNTTGKYWTIGWSELINLAIEAGIDTP